jgi:hypothetical protein
MKFRKDLMRAVIKPYKHILTVEDIDATIQAVKIKMKNGMDYVHLCYNVPKPVQKQFADVMGKLDIGVMEEKRREWIEDFNGRGGGNQLRIAFLQVWKDMIRNRKGLIGKRIQCKLTSDLGHFCGTIKAKVGNDVYLVVWDDKAKDTYVFNDSKLHLSTINAHYSFI